MGLWQVLKLDMARHKVVTLVGGGGKTTLLYALAWEGAAAGKRVIVTTTTHMLPHPRLPSRLVSQVGVLTPGGKLGPGLPIAQCMERADLVLIEGDGANRLPLKAPAEHEPVIPPESQAVIAVAGLSAVGQAVLSCCHRPNQVCALLGKRPVEPIEAKDIATLLSHQRGGRKGVEPGMEFRCALNQADEPWQESMAREIAVVLAQKGIPAAITAFDEEERGGLCWF